MLPGEQMPAFVCPSLAGDQEMLFTSGHLAGKTTLILIYPKDFGGDHILNIRRCNNSDASRGRGVLGRDGGPGRLHRVRLGAHRRLHGLHPCAQVVRVSD